MGYTINIKGSLLDLSRPCVMGILNITPDSFYAASRSEDEAAIVRRTRQIVDEGGGIIDVGACSTRPGSTPVDEAEEMERLRFSLPIVRREAPTTAISVDTFRPEVARMVVEEYGTDIINDVGCSVDQISNHSPLTPHLSPPNVPYILTSPCPTLHDTLLFFASRVEELHSKGHKDIILDPGFGFGKTVEQNHQLLAQMERLQVLELPLLVGVSRKSMVFRPLGITADEALSGTTALHAIALIKGANILRVHDVKDAVHAVKMYLEMTGS